ncbi:hypothetical protein FRB90_003453 [Tulasnella sp. 427]|nr:hypothetical protein FRB90_003453 [Tulasnella sp. 427]
MATTETGIHLTIQLNGNTYSRTYHKSDAVNNMIVVGRLSSTAPDSRLPVWTHSDQQAEIGGYIVSPGRAAFVSPVMSRQHARLVFSGDNEVYISDPPNHSHHGTYIYRNGRTFRVDHPQPMQTGDIVTFGKTVHRGGQVYEPLSARVRILPSDTTQSFASYTGHGYSLPPNIDIDVEIEEDHEVYMDDDANEPPSTHKFYAVQEVQEDSDEIASLPSPVFPRGLDAGQTLPPVMPGGFHDLPGASAYHFNVPPQSCLFEPPLPAYLHNTSLNPSQDISPFTGAACPTPLSILAPILRAVPPYLPPVLPPIIQSRFRPTIPNPLTAQEIINIEDDGEEKEVIDVDAVGSPDSSVREMSPPGENPRSFVESDVDSRTDSREGSPATSAANFSVQTSSSEETETCKDVQKALKSVTKKLDNLIAYRNQSKRRIAANKVQLDTKIASLQQNLALLKSKVELEEQGRASDLEKRKNEAMEDIDAKKRSFMDDLNVYEDDLTYEVDRVMDRVEELNAQAGEGRTKVDEYVESVRKLKEELEAALRAQIDEIKSIGVSAAETIDEVVAGVKRKHHVLDEEDTTERARSPSVAMSMSPEPEPQPEAETIETVTNNVIEAVPNNRLTPVGECENDGSLALESPRKRQKLGVKEDEGPRAGRLLGTLAASAVAVCWALGKIGEMSSLGGDF